MTTGTTLIRALLFPAAIVTGASALAIEPGEETPFPHPVALEVTLARATFEVREPVTARVTLTNLGDEPFRLLVRDDGAPYGVGLHVFRDDSSYTRHGLWLKRNGPERRKIELAGGESTAGDILVLLDFGKEYVFSDPGRYHMKWRWSPGVGFSEAYSDELRVTVVRSSRVNEDFLHQLELIALRYHVGEGADPLDLSVPQAEAALRREGILLISKIISQQKPHLVDREESPVDNSEAKLVEALTDLLNHRPDSSYSGYVARFLGLVHVKTFEHEISHRGTGYWGETKASPDHKEVTQRCRSEYQSALRYLTIARQTDLWPRTTAAFNLARLHGMAEEWAKASAACDKLRTDYAEQNGPALADKLESEMGKYRQKIARRKKAD